MRALSVLAALAVLASPTLAADAPPPPKDKAAAMERAREAAAAVLKVFRKADPGRLILSDLAVAKDDPYLLNLQVGSGWSSQPRGDRLDVATAFWKAWDAESRARGLRSGYGFRIALYSAAGRYLGGGEGERIHVDE